MDIFSSFLFFCFLRQFVFPFVNAVGYKDNCSSMFPVHSVSQYAHSSTAIYSIISDTDRNIFSLRALSFCVGLMVGHPSRYSLVWE